MGIIIRQSLKGSLVSYFGVILGAIHIVWLMPLFLSREQIGLLYFLDGAASILATFGALGVWHITLRFFPEFENRSKKHQGFLPLLLLYSGLGMALVSILYIWGQAWIVEIYRPRSPQAIPYYYFILAYAPAIIILGILENLSRLHLRIVVPALGREVILKLLLALGTVLFAVKVFDLKDLIYSRAGVFYLIILFNLLYLKQLKVLFLRFYKSSWQLERLQRMATYGIFVMVGGAGAFVINKIDSLMIPALLGTSELGVYTITAYIGSVIEIPRKAISSISSGIISKAWAKDDRVHIQNLYRQSALNQLIIGLYIFLGICMNIEEAFALIPNGDKYEGGRWVIWFIASTKILDMGMGLNAEIIQLSKYYIFNFISLMILTVFICVTNLIFIPLYGITGAAGGTFLSFALFNVLSFSFVYFKFGMQPFNWRNGASILLALATYGLVSLIPFSFSPFLNLLLRSLLISLLFPGSILLFKISPEIQNILSQLVLQARAWWENRKP